MHPPFLRPRRPPRGETGPWAKGSSCDSPSGRSTSPARIWVWLCCTQSMPSHSLRALPFLAEKQPAFSELPPSKVEEWQVIPLAAISLLVVGACFPSLGRWDFGRISVEWTFITWMVCMSF